MAEVVSFALAVAPLVVSAAEHYSTAARLIKRYRLYKSKREELISKVNVQRAIFRKTIWRLLAYDVGLGEDVASQMFADAHHPSWSSHETVAYLDLRLGDVGEVMIELLHMIQSQLIDLKIDQATSSQQSNIARNPDSGNDDRTPETTHQSTGTEHPLHNIEPKADAATYVSVRKKIRFAVSEEKLREAVENVRILTKDFRTLIEQTAPPQGRTTISKPTNSTRVRVAGYAHVKIAATDLYQALGLACTKHTVHQVHLSLKPTYGDASQIKFTIAFRQTIPLTESRTLYSNTSSPMWLTIQSQINGTIHATNSNRLLDEMRSTLKRPAESTAAEDPVVIKPRKLTKKSVKFNLGGEQKPGIPLQVKSSNRLDPEAPPVENLCMHSNFCNQLQNLPSQPFCGSQPCIGYLECSGNSKHLVYLKPKEQSISPIPSSLQLRPLREIYNLSKSQRDGALIIPLHQRITLAKELAMAVLQFHATPWLLNSICSEDVLLPGLSELTSNTRGSMHEPYVNVSIIGPNGPLTRQTTFPSRTLIRNRLLFSLGVMLLELAYQAPLHSLQRPTDVDTHMTPNTDYHTADRLRHEAASRVCPRYAEVIRKCIQCDFGHGDDLGRIQLREGFHQDVICELEDLEERLRGFTLAV